MGLGELQSLWKGETSRLLVMMAIFFVAITLVQYIEMPKGNFVLSIFSVGRSMVLEKNATLHVSNNSTSPSLNYSAPGPTGAPNYPAPGPAGAPNYSAPGPTGAPSSVVGSAEIGANHSALAPEVDSGNSSLSPVLQLPTAPVSAAVNNLTRASNSSTDLTAPVIPAKVNSPPRSPPPPAPQVPVKKHVYTLADMDQLLTEGRSPSHSIKPRWPSEVDSELVHAKSEIENAVPSSKNGDLYAPIYRNVTTFRRSYELMEQILKVYIYKEGDGPVFHQGPLTGIYASEGWFLKLMESNKAFITKDPTKAHLFYLPFSSMNLEHNLYVPNSHTYKPLIDHLDKYLNTIVRKYNFWNRTEGADHFLVACHDWAPAETRRIMSTCIKAMCNADVKEGFKFGQDVSLPETNIPNARYPLKGLGGKSARKRRTLAFFAGQMHGHVRPILLKHWQNVDADMQIFGKLQHTKGNRNYVAYMQTSKYCICPRGYEVNSPRVVEAIFYECVPVIISDNFVPPFFETLNWAAFAVFVAEKDIPKLKEILVSIPEKEYLRLYMRVRKVQQHFLWHPRPVKYDLFHMILHSIWYNRVFQVDSRTQ